MSSLFKSAELRSIKVDGTSIAYRKIGLSAGVPLVLLHHITATIDDWDPNIIDELSKARTAITFDSAGVGASGGKVPDSIEAMAQVALDFVGNLGLAQLDLLGYSMGGFVAQVMMARRPDLVRKAILVDTGPAGGEGIDRIWDVLQDAFAFAEREKRHPKQRLFFTNSSQSQKAGLAFLDRLSQPFAQPGRPVENVAIESQVKAFVAWGRSDDPYTAKISAPTLIVSGDRDEMIPLSNAVALAGRIPLAQLAVYPDASHGAIFQYTQLFVDQAKSFLNA